MPKIASDKKNAVDLSIQMNKMRRFQKFLATITNDLRKYKATEMLNRITKSVWKSCFIVSLFIVRTRE